MVIHAIEKGSPFQKIAFLIACDNKLVLHLIHSWIHGCVNKIKKNIFMSKFSFQFMDIDITKI